MELPLLIIALAFLSPLFFPQVVESDSSQPQQL